MDKEENIELPFTGLLRESLQLQLKEFGLCDLKCYPSNETIGRVYHLTVRSTEDNTRHGRSIFAENESDAIQKFLVVLNKHYKKAKL